MYHKINAQPWQETAAELLASAPDTPFGVRGPDGRDPCERDLLRMIQDTAERLGPSEGSERAWLWKCLQWFEFCHAYRRRALGAPIEPPALPWYRDAAGELEPVPPAKLRAVIDRIAAGSGWRMPWAEIGARYVGAVANAVP